MANFQTHLAGGTFASGASVLGLQGAGALDSDATLAYFALGVVGSLLPDIDSDASKPARAFFGVLAAALAFGMTLPLMGRALPLELVLIWTGVFLCARYLVFGVFTRLTVHRGVWHSWLGMGVAALATVNVTHWVLGASTGSAWVAGLVVAIGYLTHLCLDELSSVELLGSRTKRSFGTALKVFSPAAPWSSLGMLSAALALGWLAPTLDWSAPPAEAMVEACDRASLWLSRVSGWVAQRVRASVDWLPGI